MATTGNPLLDNPATKAALIASMQAQQQPQGAIMPPGGAQHPPALSAVHGMPLPPQQPINLPSSPSPTLSSQSPQIKAPRGTSEGDTAELSRKLSTGSGISQIAGKIENSRLGQAHPTLGKVLGIGAQGLAQLGDIGLRTLAPQVDAALPGTSLHHMADVHADQRQIAQDTENEQRQAQTANLQSLPALHEAQLENAQNKQAEVEQHHQAQIAEQLRAHGFKMGEDGTIQPLAYEEMSTEQQGVHDLKASQQELADARAALVKAQKDNIPAAQELARKRIENAQSNAAIAAGRLGLSQKEFEANFFGTVNGQPIPGAPADQGGSPVGFKSPLAKGAGATAQSRAGQGKAVVESGNELKSFIDANPKAFGNMEQYWQQFMNQTPIADPTASKAMAKIASFAALQPALHGFRSHDAMREFAKMIGGIPKNPEALKAAIDGLVESAAVPMIHAGTVSTVSRQGGEKEGPKEGDTKTNSSGDKIVFKGGKWGPA